MFTISILIPVKDYDILPLVHNLKEGLEKVPGYLEIIIGDDGSSESFREIYKSLENGVVKLLVSEKNIGRSAIRNRLAEESKGDFLLFMDADAEILGTAESFLRKYTDFLPVAQVICGGVVYPDYQPLDPDRRLRWFYGKNSEQKKASERNKKPYASFSGFNFVVKRSLLHKLRFNEELKQYGHEDTLFGYQLRVAGIPILHVNNPLIHAGIERNLDFINKTKLGIENLSHLTGIVTDMPAFADSVKILRFHNIIKYLGITPLLALIFIRFRERMEIGLQSGKKRLWLFSLYKICLFSTYRIIHLRRILEKQEDDHVPTHYNQV